GQQGGAENETCTNRAAARYVCAKYGKGRMIRRLHAGAAGFDAVFAQLLALDSNVNADINTRVAAIIEAVRVRGDAALVEYTEQLDGHAVTSAAELEIPTSRMQAALRGLEAPARTALETAATRITRYAEAQKQQ